MELSDILPSEAVKAPVRAGSKKRLLQDISDQAAPLYGLDGERIYRELLERETLGPTGVGRGVAIPHARLPDLDRVVGMFLRLEKAIDFEAVDRQPVDLVFALLAPKDAGADHLKALARVSRTLRDEAICTKLRSTHEPSALYSILTDGKGEKPE